MEQNNNVNNKSFKGLIFINVILVILVIGLIGFIVYDKVVLDKNDSAADTTINTPNTNNDKIEKEENNEESKEEIELIDNNVLYNNVSSMINSFITKELTPYSIKFNYNYMTDVVAQNNFVISALLSNKSINKEYDVDAFGEEGTGYVTFSKTDFTNMYINIIGNSPDYNQITNANNQIKINNDKLSGTVVTGPHSFDVKYNEVTYKDGVYTVKMDYSTEEISSVIEIKLTVNRNNTYKFNSLVVINK